MTRDTSDYYKIDLQTLRSCDSVADAHIDLYQKVLDAESAYENNRPDDRKHKVSKQDVDNAYQSLLEFDKQSGDRSCYGNSLNNAAWFNRHSGDKDQSINLFEQAAKVYKADKNYQLAAMVMNMPLTSAPKLESKKKPIGSTKTL